MVVSFLVGGVLGVVVGLGVGGNSPTPATTAPTDSSTRQAQPTPTEPPSEKPTPPPDDGIQRFGTTFAYTNGLAVRVSKPQPYQPSQYASGGSQPYNVVFNVTFINNSKKPYSPVDAYYSVQSGNREAEEIYDSPRLNGTPGTSVLPGRKVSFPVGFNVKDQNDLVLEFSPGFDYAPAMFDLHEDESDG